MRLSSPIGSVHDAARGVSLLGAALVLGILGVALWGCSGGDAPQKSGVKAESDVVTGGLFEVGGGDDTTGGVSFGDVATGDGGAASPDTFVLPGTFGAPCQSNEDCDANFCIPTAKGKICTKKCVETCPSGFSCGAVKSGADVVYICLPAYGRLCDPCTNNKACNEPGGVGNVCVSFGPDGSFCGSACGPKSPCPSSHECQTVVDPASGGAVKQCIPKSGQCTCSPKAISEQLSTTCVNKNLYGACEGVRACGAGGLGACQAPVPKPEECNGVDDDCDGQTDNFDISAKCTNKNEFGTCTGKLTACVKGKPQCDAPTPAPETCNGLDDDCDGVTDNTSQCDDGNPCTKDQCNTSGSCKHSPFDGVACDDGDGCSQQDKCAGGKCQAGVPLDCDDNDPCSKDSCSPTKGCVHTPQSGTCPDDGKACTQDVCSNGKCSHPPKAKGASCSDDGDECSQDICDSGVCTHPAIKDGEKCADDGNPCTSDFCGKGKCKHLPVAFTVPCASDGNVCTADVCDKGGCTHQPLGSDKSCLEDGDPCTQDVCLLGKCSHPPTANLKPCQDDGLPCTDDFCSSGKCKHPYLNGKACADDGNLCTQDVCSYGKCSHPAATNKPCAEDGNPCTQDKCQGGQCKHPYANATCTDNNPCTTVDYCDFGKCKGINMLNCNDNNPCTYDTCNKGQGCVHTGKSGASCDDGNVCTTVDTCSNGVCKGSGGKTCDDGNPCTNDGCDSSGGCKFVANSLPCKEDGNLCTTDVCASKQCTHKAKKNGAACTDDGNPCTSGACSSGVCKQTTNSNVCNDGNACTSNDKCVGGKCSGTAFKDCSDGNPCTQDSCDKYGKCTHQAVSNVSCKAGSGECPIGICQGGSCVSKPGVTCQAKYKADLCSSVKVAGTCAASGKCVASSAPPGYTCPGCNGICIKCLIFQFCVPLF